MVARGGEPHVEGWLFATTENLCTARSLSLQGIWEDYTRVASLTINKSLFIIIFFRKIITVIPFVKPSGFVEGWRRRGMELAAKVEWDPMPHKTGISLFEYRIDDGGTYHHQAPGSQSEPTGGVLYFFRVASSSSGEPMNMIIWRNSPHWPGQI